ncbi:ATP-dependent DNA helicase RecQ [Marinilactibacillus piezotolerans]|uniref:ATP-dependent DNA helicase RecQ n=1 Tax=Marinilactibacillus piezotolerans TaxID=258723 RepID=A0A1I3VQM7_9LACT|nr:RecQ family ATP-dependent DNA helicase [Marinilactibacillus piezotolerans]SFJ97462.1 ATP-dependent DNA helicase RecQ [Marinilactibacillus piezotolerans]
MNLSVIEQTLNEKFGFKEFRPGQIEAIEAALQKFDTLVMLPTGSGKSICYQLPGYLKEGLVLIVSPLLSLMQDQVERLKKSGERQVAALNSLSSSNEKKRIFNNLNKLKFLFISPEMIQYDFVINRLIKVKIALFVVDEAHCISQWGMDFRPDYLKIGEVKEKLNNPVTMALTATATNRVRDEIKDSLKMDEEQTKEVIYSVNRDAIKLKVEICEGNKKEKLKEFVRNLQKPGIIYFSSKKLADELAQELRSELGLSVESYHSDILTDDKIKIQQQFIENSVQIICATSAFGMGIDKSDVRFIIHYHVPSNPEMYLQEIGRCSRDGKDGIAILLFEYGDQFIQKRLQEDALPDKSLLSYVYKNYHKIKSNQEDPRVQIAQYYQKSGIPLSIAVRQVEIRERLKSEQLDFMMQYIKHKGCKRNFILKYFDEVIDVKPDKCCSSCNPSLEECFYKYEEGSIVRNKVDMNWRKRLKELYKIDDESIKTRKI